MLLIMACGSCVRRILQESIRGRKMSSANFVWPVHLARASTLRNGLPTTFSGLLGIRRISFPQRRKVLFPAVQTLARQFHRFTAHARRGQLNRFVDLDVAG